ncbi:hypothetical protein [Parahaliea mediterranea]|uniref:hypothetical protein n=1 Tax=Parahaliea mediterranea TaxID=651086 RepID=UPI000E2FBCDC|nr:hypothetical protein [Parahaliea mediterranea]
MDIERAKVFRPVAEPRIIEGVYSEDQHQRLLDVVRRNGPWTLIISQHFKSAEELIATTSGSLPEGVEPSLDMFLSPVFRGYFSHGGVCSQPEIEDCFYNPAFLKLVRDYWGAKYAEPDSMLFNIQGPSQDSGNPHVDGTRFRGLTIENTPIWLMNTMVKSGLFKRWQARKAQVIAWYYRGKIGGGFSYWPDGPHLQPKQIQAPMWGRAVVVENEMMFHTAQSCGPKAMRKPEGLAFDSVMEADPSVEGGWRIRTGDRVIQQIPEAEFRFLVHWGANVYMDLDELKRTVDHTDDITHDQVFDIFIQDLKARGEHFDMPSDPLTDKAFIGLLTRVYHVGTPLYFPPEPEDGIAA